MECNVLLHKIAKNYLKNKLLPAVALSTGLAGCAPDVPTVVESPKATRRPALKRFPFLDNAIKEVTPEVDKILYYYREDFKDPKELYNFRRWYSIRFYEILKPYYDKYDRLSENDKKYADKKLNELENFIYDQQKKVFSKLDEVHLKFKPWQRSRFENRGKY